MVYFNQCGSCPYLGIISERRKKRLKRRRNRTDTWRQKMETRSKAQLSEKLPVKQKCQPLFT